MAALAGTVAKSDIAMQVAAAPFGIAGKRTSAVAIVLTLRHEAPEALARFASYEVAVNAYDYTAKRRASDRFKVRATLRPGRAEDATLEVQSRLELPPGRYQLRVAAEQRFLWTTVAANEPVKPRTTGSVYSDLDVPDFAGAPLSLSGLVVNVSPPLSIAPQERFTPMTPVAPTTLRQFIGADSVSAFLRVYQGGAHPLAMARVTAQIVDEADRTVFEKSDDLDPRAFGTARAADYLLQVPTRNLTPGQYLLAIEAKAGAHADKRSVRFTMR
jgi:hypothetical protein